MISAVVGLLVLLVLGPAAHAAPTPTPTPSPSASKSEDPCDLLYGPAKKYCERDDSDGSSGGGSLDPTSTLDPLSSLADGIAEGAAWVVDRLSDAVAATSAVDFTNSAFLKTYAIVFAASTVLVVMIWLWAVVKRAVRGAPMLTALGEAVGLLWATVIASAFTPLVLYVVVQAVDGITAALAGGSEHAKVFAAFSKALQDLQDGGPFVKIILALLSMLAAGVLWIELVIRAALLYAGAVLGTLVYAGLVDRELWSRVRRWVGIMVAIILVKPIIVIVLDLANALTSGDGADDDISAIMSGLSIILLAIFASAMIFRMVPGMGDEIVAARRDSYDPASRQSSAIVTKPVSGITAGINTHAARDTASRGTTTQTSSSVSHTAGGIAAHSTRPTSSATRPPRSDVPPQDNRGGGSGS